MIADTKAQARERAYSIWEAEGRPEGRALDHWLLAERELSAKPTTRKRPARAKAKPSEAGGKAAAKKAASRRSTSKKRS